MPEPVRYWSLEEQAARGMADPLEGDEEEITDVLEGALSEAVRLRLVSDVPLGAFLSGGVDSSAVAALMQSHSSRPVKTFTIGSPDAGYDEAGHARRVAAHLGTEHTELLVDEARAREVVPLLPRFLRRALCRRLSDSHFSGVPHGQGACHGMPLGGTAGTRLSEDTTATCWPRPCGAGWNLCPPWRAGSRLGGMRRGGEAVLHAAYKLAEPLLPERKRHRIFRDKVQKVAEAMAATDRLDFFHSLVSYWREPERLVAGARPPATRFTNLDPRLASLDFPSLMMALDQTTYLPDDILTKVDRASMAVSLEARVPVLDHRVVETAWRIPVRFKIGGLGKHILRRVLYRHVPAGLVERPKQGFGVPLDSLVAGAAQGLGRGTASAGTSAATGSFESRARGRHVARARIRQTEPAVPTSGPCSCFRVGWRSMVRDGYSGSKTNAAQGVARFPRGREHRSFSPRSGGAAGPGRGGGDGVRAAGAARGGDRSSWGHGASLFPGQGES